MGTDSTDFHGFESVLIRETRVHPCPDFKLSGSQMGDQRYAIRDMRVAISEVTV